MNAVAKRIAVVSISTLALVAYTNPIGQCGNCGMKQTGSQVLDKALQAQVVKGGQKATVTVAGGKYNPSKITVVKGKPVELSFKLGENPGCGTVLVIKDLKVKKQLRAGATEVVKFTPSKAGAISFTCGMGMFKGTIEVK